MSTPELVSKLERLHGIFEHLGELLLIVVITLMLFKALCTRVHNWGRTRLLTGITQFSPILEICVCRDWIGVCRPAIHRRHIMGTHCYKSCTSPTLWYICRCYEFSLDKHPVDELRSEPTILSPALPWWIVSLFWDNCLGARHMFMHIYTLSHDIIPFWACSLTRSLRKHVHA